MRHAQETPMQRLAPDWRRFVAPAVALVCSASLTASMLRIADATPPVINAATLAPKADGNGNWHRTPVTLTLSATDDVAVAKLQYSLDGGAAYLDAAISAGSSVTASVTIAQQGNTPVRYRAIDSAGNYSVGDAAVLPAASGRGGGGRGAPGRGAPAAAAAGPPGRGPAGPA